MNSSHDIIQAILAARRLLSEHVDVLHLLADVETQRQTSPSALSVIGTATVTVLSAATAAICARRLLTLHSAPAVTALATIASTSSGIYALRRLRQQWQHTVQLGHVTRLLRTIDAFDRALRQHIKYLREYQHLLGPGDAVQQARQLRVHQQANDTVTAAMPVIWATYAAIQRLEVLPLAHEYDDVYLPTEPLDNCELFSRTGGSEFSAQNVRQVQEIFQFLQSQLLVRLGLATVYNAAEAAAFIAADVPRLCEALRAQLAVFGEQRRVQCERQEIRNKLDAVRSAHQLAGEPSALIGMRTVALDLGARMMALAQDLRYVEGAFRESETLEDRELRAMDGDLQRFGERLELCRDEYQRMVCVYRRAVHGRSAMAMGDMAAACAKTNASPSPIPAVFNETAADAAAVVPDAEFYALIEPAEETSDSDTNAAISLDCELRELDVKVVKHRFQPVLRQLKSRLEPINEAMRDRERKFCAANGIPLEEDTEKVGAPPVEDEAAASGDSKRTARDDVYADMRKFLQDKQPMGFLPGKGFPMPHAALEEEILE